GVLLLILGVIVPKFALVFKSTGKPLPGSLKLLMDTSELINGFWWLGLIAVGVFLFLVRAIKQDGPIREKFDAFLLKLPIVGKVVHFSNIARMLRTMSVLIKSGVHLLNAVNIAVKVIDNSLIRNSLSYLGNDLRKGEKISYCFSKSKFIPTMVVRMLTVGEETGQPSEMMANIADRMEDDVKKRLKRIIALFEPVMIVVLALVVGAILAVMFMSIMDMQSF
ncbi:MAG: type II secretion system F family protein, partial [Lentisphaeria bacterium]